jgi:hypothetical protein
VGGVPEPADRRGARAEGAGAVKLRKRVAAKRLELADCSSRREL